MLLVNCEVGYKFDNMTAEKHIAETRLIGDRPTTCSDPQADIISSSRVTPQSQIDRLMSRP